jgi:hypothetical protein
MSTDSNPITNLKAAYEILTTVCIGLSETRRVDAEAVQMFEARRQLATALETLGGLE